jgi:CHASE3 domain sensor protein
MSLIETLRRTFTWLTVVSLLPIVVAVVGSGYITYRYNALLTETRTHIADALMVTTAIDDLMLGLVDAETGQRGYLITGDNNYLEPYKAASEGLSPAFSDLRRLIADDADQMASLDRIAELSNQKLTELGKTIRVRQIEGFAAARSIVESDEGKDTMDRIRAEIEAMRQREAVLLAIYAEATRTTERRVVLVVAFCIVLSIFGRVVSLIIPVAWRRSRLRKRADRSRG